MAAFLDNFGIVTNSQHGYRKSKSTKWSAYNPIEYVYKSLDCDKQVVGLL